LKKSSKIGEKLQKGVAMDEKGKTAGSSFLL